MTTLLKIESQQATTYDLRAGDAVRIHKESSQHIFSDSLFDGYVVEGLLISQLTVGVPLILWRRERNGIKMLGIFNTSIVERIERIDVTRWRIFTQHSTYLIELESRYVRAD